MSQNKLMSLRAEGEACLSGRQAIPFLRLLRSSRHNPSGLPRNDKLFNAFGLAIFSSVVLFYCYLLPAHAAYDPQGRRNPFMPLVSPDGRILKVSAQPSGGLLLEGIIYDQGGSSYAIINSSVVRQNDKIEGYNVLKIEKNKVVLSKDSKIRELEISPGDQ